MGNKRFMEVFDVLFIMILCFATLLTTMLMRGKVLVGSGSGGGMTYTFSAATFLLTFLGMGTYLAIVIPQSNRELGEIVEGLYGAKIAEPGAGPILESAPAENPR